MADYDSDNLFARILRGELPAHTVHEDESTLAFLDIMPRADGHTLVIPKAASRNILDIAPDDLAALMRAVQWIARAGLKAFDAQGVTVQQFNEAAGGQVIFHTHVHIIPRRAGDEMRPPAAVREEDSILEANAEKLRAALAG